MLRGKGRGINGKIVGGMTRSLSFLEIAHVSVLLLGVGRGPSVLAPSLQTVLSCSWPPHPLRVAYAVEHTIGAAMPLACSLSSLVTLHNQSALTKSGTSQPAFLPSSSHPASLTSATTVQCPAGDGAEGPWPRAADGLLPWPLAPVTAQREANGQGGIHAGRCALRCRLCYVCSLCMISDMPRAWSCCRVVMSPVMLARQALLRVSGGTVLNQRCTATALLSTCKRNVHYGIHATQASKSSP